MKKPRGRTGFARATGARELSFPEANFPRTKADIETWIVKCFFSSLKENGWEPFCLANPARMKNKTSITLLTRHEAKDFWSWWRQVPSRCTAATTQRLR